MIHSIYKPEREHSYINPLHATTIGKGVSHNPQMIRMKRLHRNISINEYYLKGLNTPLIFSYFELRKVQQDNICYLFRKHREKMINRRPTLFATLVYCEGIPITEILKLFKTIGFRLSFKMIKECYLKLNLKRKPSDSFYLRKIKNEELHFDIQKFIHDNPMNHKPAVKYAIATWFIMQSKGIQLSRYKISKMFGISQAEIYVNTNIMMRESK
jgi:hypothetical protein